FEFEREAVKESSIFNYGFIISITYENIIFAEQAGEGLNIAQKKVFVVFGHGRWLKGFVNFVRSPEDPKMGIVSNASLTHIKIEKQEDGSFRLVSRESYRSL
ncbi:MAG: hypothetical protein HRU09_16840, partial [Oligoflexales bacterium]|nr:hypothetical protein [Oligoflexales bacterium]